MSDILITALIPLVLLVVMLWGNRPASRAEEFFSKNYTTALKAAACIIVILVHVPAAHQNPMQDAIGSFAFICVTIFFMVSAYGMQFSCERKASYLHTFWRNRLVALLVPAFAINIVNCVYKLLINANGGGYFWPTLLHINDYVLVLLEYCVWFYLVVVIGRRLKASERTIDAWLMAGVIISSIVLYFFFDKEGWCWERWGLVYGLLIYRHYPRVVTWLDTHRKAKAVVFIVLALIAGAAYLKYKPVYIYGEYLLKIVLGILILTALFLLTSKRTWGNRSVALLGCISYEVYLSHGFIMGVLSAHTLLSSGVFVLTTVVLTILFSWIIHTAISKPVVNKLRA